MNRQKINLVGGGFSHSPSTSGYEPLYIEWVKNIQTSPISIYVDYGIKTNINPNTKNYAWLCESKTIIPDLYEWAKNNIDYLKNNFISVFTHDVGLTTLSDIFKLTQCSGKSFIKDGNLYNKTKLVSMIASNKVMCEEHSYRQSIIKKFSSKCDHYGRGYNEIINKEDGLKDYCFSFVIENATYSNMFTEKITDCFMTGTIPVYYGMKNIGDFFNDDGIIILDDDFNINDLNFELYLSKIDSVKDNLKRSLDLLVAEDYIYLKFLKNEM
jgi:hypothetical protein